MRVEMQHVDLVMLKHRIKEGREGRNQASPKGIYEDWDLGGCLSRKSARRGPSHRLPPLIEAGSKNQVHIVHGLVVEHPRPAERWRKGRRRSWQRERPLPLFSLFQRHGDGAGGARVRLEKRSRATRKQGNWGSKAQEAEE